MPTLEPAKDLDPNAWYQLSEFAVDNGETVFHGMLQPTAPGGDLRVWPANKNSYWQFVRPELPDPSTDNQLTSCSKK